MEDGDRRGISQADDVNRLLAPLLIGKDPLALNELCILRDENIAAASM